MRTRVTSMLAAVLVLGLVATACSSGGGAGTITLDGQKASDHGSQDVSGASSSAVELNNDKNDYFFSPTILKGTAGEKITLDLSNVGTALHNFTIPDQNIDQDVQPDGKAQVTVTFPSSGTLVFFCKYHQTRGMVGALQVA
jgi:plastocyanin